MSLGDQPRALDAPREVAVAEVEPDVGSELAQRAHHLERVAAQAPAALVDHVREPEAHEIRIGRDMRAVDLDVVARVHDRAHSLRRDDLDHPARELRAAGPAGEHHCADVGRVLRRGGRRARARAAASGAHSHSFAPRSVRRIPAWTL